MIEAQDAAGGRLARIELRRLRVPLKKPYRLSFGPLHAFDCVVVSVAGADGRRGWGEAALLPGYTPESVGTSWELATVLAFRMRGPLDRALAMLDEQPAERAFTVTAFRTAIEQMTGAGVLSRSGRVPLLAGINGSLDDPAVLEAEIEDRLAEGYRTLKLKVGFDLGRDLAFVAAVQRLAAGRARLRIDANQGYSREDGATFVARLAPDDVELVEQPCAAHDWDAAVAVKRAAGVPVMLDESVGTEDDIRRAAALGCADYIKLKLMKMGGLERLSAGLRLIRELGMTPVLGNGVATDLGCWMEGCAALGQIDNAGEMNGFLRPSSGLLSQPLAVEDGALVLDGAPRAPDEEALATHTLAEYGTPVGAC